MEDAFFSTALYSEFAQLEELAHLPDESTILRFRHRRKKHKLAQQILESVNELLTQRGLPLKAGIAVDATLIQHRRRPKTKIARATTRCTPARRVSSGTLASRPTLASMQILDYCTRCVVHPVM